MKNWEESFENYSLEELNEIRDYLNDEIRVRRDKNRQKLINDFQKAWENLRKNNIRICYEGDMWAEILKLIFGHILNLSKEGYPLFFLCGDRYNRALEQLWLTGPLAPVPRPVSPPPVLYGLFCQNIVGLSRIPKNPEIRTSAGPGGTSPLVRPLYGRRRWILT